MKNYAFLDVFYSFRKIIYLVIIIAGFFLFYNIFLIDHTLEDLRFLLQQTSSAYDIKDLEGLDMVLNDLMMSELIVPVSKLNSKNIASLEFANTIVTTGKGFRQIEDIRNAIGSIVKDKENGRGLLLNILDGINDSIRKATTALLNSVRTPAKARKYEKVDMALFDKGRAMEKTGRLKEAVPYYNDFIAKYPLHDRTSAVKLRLAYVYHKLGEYDKALALYNEIIRLNFNTKESDIAKILLFKLQEAAQAQRRLNLLLARSSEVKAGDTKEKQDIYYQLGVENAKLLKTDDASNFFKRAVKAEPESEVAVKSKFNVAWLKKKGQHLEDSLSDFSNIAKENPNSDIALECLYQMADVYHRQGKYKESIELYTHLAESHKGDPDTEAIRLFQAGASYMYDLNDDEKAKEIFGRLIKEYPSSPYARYLSPRNPIGIFVTYLVPRATRVVMWRGGGLVALSGYAGELSRFETVIDQTGFNNFFNNWLKHELPDTVGNLYVDIKGSEIEFRKDKAIARAVITMGKFSVKGEAEFNLEITKEGSLGLTVTKVVLGGIPVPPVLINNTLTGISLIMRKHFPITITKISMNPGEILIDGYGSERMLRVLSKRMLDETMAASFDLNDIDDAGEQKRIYASFKEKFPESDFSPLAVSAQDIDSLFLDFITRMYIYTGFKLLETTKDTKFDYERSIRTLGRLMISKGKFKVNYSEPYINAALKNLISGEFPIIMDQDFFVDIKSLQVHFTDEGDIKFEVIAGVGFVHNPIMAEDVSNLQVEGRARLDIGDKSRIPRFIFKDIFLNEKVYPVEKLNIISQRCLDLLEEGHIPLEVQEINISNGAIALKGEGARDFTARVFTDPYIFVIFKIRDWDKMVAGIKSLNGRESGTIDYGRRHDFGKG